MYVIVKGGATCLLFVCVLRSVTVFVSSSERRRKKQNRKRNNLEKEYIFFNEFCNVVRGTELVNEFYF